MLVWFSVSTASWQVFVVYFLVASLRFLLYHEALFALVHQCLKAFCSGMYRSRIRTHRSWQAGVSGQTMFALA
jgi:hypothetical protein